jgi:hypothetical protein
MAARDIRASGRPTRVYGVRDAIRDELREKPLSVAEVLGFVLGLAGVLLFLCLFLATGSYGA